MEVVGALRPGVLTTSIAIYQSIAKAVLVDRLLSNFFVRLVIITTRTATGKLQQRRSPS